MLEDRLELRMTTDQKHRWQKTADAQSLSLAQWLRMLADNASGKDRIVWTAIPGIVRTKNED